MTEPNEMSDTLIQELNNVVISDTDETKEKEESFSFLEEQDLDDIPPSLLRYFETSKSRAAVCEKLILKEPADFITSHNTEDMMNLPIELDEDMMKLKEQVICDSENEENNTSSDTRLLPAPTETVALFTHNVSVCPNNNEDEVGTDEHMESEKHFAFEMRTLEMSLNEEERKKINKYKTERQKQYCADEDRKRQIERDFQRELKKIMEAEMHHQMEVELMEKRAQEKLEQEFLLQQELISSLQRRVEEERRVREEELKRMKEEQDKRKREEEKITIEAERKRIEDEEKIKREAERKIMEEEEKIKREAERKGMEEETVKKKEEERKIEEIKLKKQERKNKEEEKRRMEREDKRKREEERYQRDLEEKRLEDEMRMMNKEEEKKKKEEVMREEEEEEEEGDRKKMAQEKMYEEVRKRDKKECGNVDEEIKLEESKKKEEKERKKIEKTPRPIEEHEKRKEEDERKAKEEEQRRRQKEKMSRHKEEEDYRKSEEDIRLKEDKEGYKKYDVDREMEHESKTKDKQEKQEEEKGNWKEERNHVEAEKTQNKEEVGENKTEVNNKTEEEITLKKTEVTVVGANEVQEKKEKIEHNSMIGQNEKNKMDKKERSLASQLEDGPSWASASPAPLHSESTICPASTEAMKPQHDPDKNISQTTINKTVDCENQEARASAVSVSLPMCLPEHTEQKRLTWMKDCIPWSKLSLQSRRKREGSVRSRRRARRAAEVSSLPPLCPDTLLQATGWKSLQQVTTVTLEDLPDCNLSTLAQCTQLQSLSLRRCGLKSLEGINQLPHLCYIDAQENDISFVDCENMTSLRVLQLGHNKLTSIHGLAGAENLDVLGLSHNSITRIAGLESMRRLQRLSIDHNQLISTKGLRDVYTLLHLNCSHNHLASVEALENSALLNTLDLRANSLTEPPSLNNQVLLRELHLDDNSISSLQGLTACWLPLMQHLSVAQNRITHLPSVSDFVSLANLDLRFNCMSELQNVCESLDGCQFLREVHLTGNPLQQESGWRSTLQKAVPGLRAIDEQETDSSLTPPAVQQVSLASGSFLTFCQAQLQQICDLQQQHSRELSNASSSLDAVQTSCRHFTEALQLAEDQRFAHEYGDTTVADQHRPAGRTTPEETLDLHDSNAEKHADCPGTESTGKVPSVIPNKDNIRCSSWTFDEKAFAESLHANLEVASKSNHEDLDIQNTAAVVIQQLWRKYREKCGNISSPSTAEKGGGRGGDGTEPESRPSYINGSVVGKDYAATVIQAFWRGFTLRRRLASALAAVTCPDTGEDDTFEEVDVDEFVFDEAALEKTWILPLSEEPPYRRYPVSEQPLSLEPPGPFPEPSEYIFPPPLALRPKQAWVAREQAYSAGQRICPVSSNRSKSPASNSEVSGFSERSEKILEEWGFTNSHTALLMLKRAQNMKSKKQQQKKQRDPSARLALFRNCSYQLGPVEARKRQARQNRTDRKVREAELGLQREEKTEHVKQEQAQQWLHTQAAHSDRDSESTRFLPEISSDILNGGRVQLVADPGYTERLHHASGLWANSSLAAQPCKENNYPRRNSFGHAREEIPAPQRVSSAPTKKERISFRDNPVQLSGGWGGGKKRGKVHK